MSVEFNHSRESRIGDWHCMVQQEPWNLLTKVFLIKHRGDGTADMATIEKGDLVLKHIKLGDDTKPMLTLPYDAWQTILDTLGSITPDIKKEVVDSELKAVKFHLEDMRSLVFRKDTSKGE